VRVCGRAFLRLECIGKGGSSRVYRVLGEDLVSYALKRVKLGRTDAATVSPYLNEMALMRRLAGRKHIIRLLEGEVSYESRCVHMVMELGQRDLNRLLADERERLAGAASALIGSPPKPPVLQMDGNLLRVVWQQMLLAVQTIHEARIVHGDLKPANFVFVDGDLKLIDFGIAKAMAADTTHIMRDGTVGTLNYMSPEAILDGTSSGAAAGGQRALGQHKLGRASDIWSLGCILYQMAHGRTPFADLPLIPKLHAIVSDDHAIPFPPCADVHLAAAMRACLQRAPAARPPIASGGGVMGLLEHPLLHQPQSATQAAAAEAAVAGSATAAAGAAPAGLPITHSLLVGLARALLVHQAARGGSAAHDRLPAGAAEAAAEAAMAAATAADVGNEALQAAVAAAVVAVLPPPRAVNSAVLAQIRHQQQAGTAAAGATALVPATLQQAASASAPRACASAPPQGAPIGTVPASMHGPQSHPLQVQGDEIRRRLATLRPTAAAPDKENASGGPGKAGTAVARGRPPQFRSGGGGLEEALRRGLSERFAHVAGGVGGGSTARSGSAAPAVGSHTGKRLPGTPARGGRATPMTPAKGGDGESMVLDDTGTWS